MGVETQTTVTMRVDNSLATEAEKLTEREREMSPCQVTQCKYTKVKRLWLMFNLTFFTQGEL